MKYDITALAVVILWPLLVVAQTPGQSAADRLGTTSIDLEQPPAYDNSLEAYDSLGLDVMNGTNAILNNLKLKPVPREDMLPADVGSELSLSIEQAVFMGLQNNRELFVEQINPVITGTFEEIERAVFDPVIFAEAEANRETLQQTDRATGQLFSVTGNNNSLRAGVSQSLPTGTDYELSISQNRTDSDRSPRLFSNRIGVTLTQALLRGFSIDANMASIRQAEVDSLISVYELRGFTETLVADIETAYWDYVLAERQIEIFTAARDVAEQQMNETRQRINVGQLSETELATVKAEVALRQQNLIDARSDLEKIRLRLLRLLNPDTGSGWATQLAATTTPDVQALPAENIEDRLALALRLRPELNQARLQIERGRLEVVRTKNGLLPQLDFFLTLGKSGFADSFGPAFRDIDGSSYDVGAGIRLELPAGNRAASASHRGALATRDQATASLNNLGQLIALDIRTAVVESGRAREQIEASRATRELQEEVLRAEQARFRVGNSTAFDVALVRRDFIESQIGEIEAIVAYRKALIELYRLEGSLLKRRGVEIPGGELVNVSMR